MKLAYFSPLPPQKSGISDYSEVLIPFLAKYCDIDLWVDGINPSTTLLKKFKIIDYSRNRSIRTKLTTYDVIVYNMGNNPFYHAGMYDIFLEYPGIVILHDYVLYFLITGYYLDMKKDVVGYIHEFCYNYGYNSVESVKKILRSTIPPLQYQSPENYPLVKRLITEAKGIIVHSASTRNLILNQGCLSSKVIQINQVNYNNELEISERERIEIKEKYCIRPSEILITSFGYIASTKRNLQIIEVIEGILATTPIPVKYLMVGEGNCVDGLLSENIKKTGYVSIREFEKLILCSDIVINMRYPSMGETSATLLRGMTAGKPCIVSNIAWFSELPDDTVVKITTDSLNEKEELKNALLLLLNNRAKMIEYGRNARSFTLRFHDPDTIAKNMINFFTNCYEIKDNFSKDYIDLHDNRMNELGLKKDTSSFIRDYRKNQCERIKDIEIITPNTRYPEKKLVKRLTDIFFYQSKEKNV